MDKQVKESVVIDERVVKQNVGNLPLGEVKAAANVVVEIDDVAESGVDPDEADPNKPALTETAWFSIGLALIFKGVHVLLYFLSGPIWGGSTAKIYKLLFTIVLSAVDFWTMKNVVGRKLVGMLWRRKEDESDSDEQWVFVCKVDERRTNGRNSVFFWGSMVSMVLFWLLLFLFNLVTISFEALANLIPVVLNAVNFLAFVKCSDYQKRVAKKRGANLLTSAVFAFGLAPDVSDRLGAAVRAGVARQADN